MLKTSPKTAMMPPNADFGLQWHDLLCNLFSLVICSNFLKYSTPLSNLFLVRILSYWLFPPYQSLTFPLISWLTNCNSNSSLFMTHLSTLIHSSLVHLLIAHILPPMYKPYTFSFTFIVKISSILPCCQVPINFTSLEVYFAHVML